MDEQTEKLAVELVPQPSRNRGWFQRGDRRINRDGRPLGSKVATGELPEDCAQCADRVQQVFFDEAILKCCLTQPKAPWAADLPAGFQIVDSRVDAKRGGVWLTIRSSSFRRIAKGTRIPELTARFFGMQWCNQRIRLG